MYSARQVLKENYRDYFKKHAPTDHQKREVQKMIDCSKNSCNGLSSQHEFEKKISSWLMFE